MPEWEEKIRAKTAGLWESLSKIWTVTVEYGERFKTIVEESIECQKMKGKRELLNLQSFVNYGAIKASPRCRKGKTHLM